jgi:DNA primase
MIPIHNEQGDVVGFSGRIYDSQDKTAKYINSPQTKIFTKSQVLYNLHRAINAIKMMDRAVLFEGYMDVIAAHKAGIKEAVASMGTSLTKDQVRLLSKYTKNILICYDGDNAGIEATDRAIKMFQASGFTVKVVMLPNKMDPDDYITKHGSTALNTYINDQWIDTIEFSYLKSNMAIDFSKLLDIERFKKTIFDLIKNSSNTIIESYIKRLSQDINISVDSIRQDFNQYTKRNIQNIGHQLKKKVETIDNKYVNAERRMVTYFKEEVTYVKRFIQEFGPVFCIDSRVREIKELIEDIYFHSGLPAEDINDVGERLEKIMNEQQKAFHDKYLVNPNLDVIKKEYDDLFDTMQKYQEDVQLELLEEQIRQADTIEEKIRLANYRDIRIKEERHGKR